MNIEDMSEKGLENLRLGIVEQAAEDYISLLANFETSSSDCNLEECRAFFLDHSGFRCFVISSLSIL